MDREINLLEYLPGVLREVKEFKALSAAENPETVSIWEELENVLDDQFVNESTLNGVKRWESILGIKALDTDTISDRRFRILSRLNEQLPYTYKNLDAQLATAIGQIKTGVDTGDATATAEGILAGLTAYVKGAKVTGSLPRRNSDGNGYTNMNSKKSNTFPNGIGRLHFPILPGAYLDNAFSSIPANNKDTPMGYIDDANFIPDNILSDKQIFGLQGSIPNKAGIEEAPNSISASGHPDGRILVRPNNGYYTTGSVFNAYSDGYFSQNILSTANIFGLQGSIPVVTPDNADQYPALAVTGWPGNAFMKINGGAIHEGVNWIRAGMPDLYPENILSGKSIFGVAGTAVQGKRWASGTHTVTLGLNSQYEGIKSFKMISDYGAPFKRDLNRYALISGLSFTPSIIVLTCGAPGSFGWTVILYVAAFGCSITLCYDVAGKSPSYAPLNNEIYAIPAYDGYVNSSGFCIPVTYGDGTVYTWWAYE